jgi:ubiquinone biosynthesis protein UbiJ
MPKEKISHVQIGQMMKLAGATIRQQQTELTETRAENEELKQKVAHFELKDRAEKLATAMEERNLRSELSYPEKVAHLMGHPNLAAVEAAVDMNAPQVLKVASVHDDGTLGTDNTDSAEGRFNQALASLE